MAESFRGDPFRYQVFRYYVLCSSRPGSGFSHGGGAACDRWAAD